MGERGMDYGRYQRLKLAVLKDMKRCMYIFMMLILAAAVSCTGEISVEGIGGRSGCEVMIPFSLYAVPETGCPEMKAPGGSVVENDEISDVYIIGYNITSGDPARSNITVFPKNYDREEIAEVSGVRATIPVILPDNNQTYAYIAIANTHEKPLDGRPLLDVLMDANTMAKLVALSKKVSSTDDLYNVQASEEERTLADVLMSGRVDIMNEGGTFYEVNAKGEKIRVADGLSFRLYRNMAKLTVTVTNDGSAGVTVKSVQVRNVPDRIFFADRLRDFSYAKGDDNGYYTANPSPAPDEAAFIDYPVETSVEGEPAGPFTYYIPRNCRGKAVGSGARSEKNRYADRNATYVEVMAEREGMPLRYRFYLGEDMIDDCNVMPNHHYILDIDISGAGSPGADSRVEDLGFFHLAEANSYIINPLEGSSQPVYALPATVRVNRFWGTLMNSDDQIADDTGWVAEVIWQDVAGRRLMTFCDRTGENEADTYVWTGHGNIYFKPAPGARGNVLIGLKKTGSVGSDDEYSSYLWSWHLWITDYAPDERRGYPWEDGKYIYSVPGGEVHRYDDGVDNDGVQGVVWKVEYRNRYVMDRNLGALGADLDVQNSNGENLYHQVTGMMYQYGRKDPFPIYTGSDNSTRLHDIEGVALQGRKAYEGLAAGTADYVLGMRYPDTAADYAESVNRPYVYYGPAEGDWLADNRYNAVNVIWNNPPAYKSEMESEGVTDDKSLFDPCPPGWKVPKDGVFYVVKSQAGEYGYDISISADAGVTSTVFYPYSGFRRANGTVGGTLSFSAKYFSAWSCLGYDSMGYGLDISLEGVSRKARVQRAYAQAVRCIQD